MFVIILKLLSCDVSSVRSFEGFICLVDRLATETGLLIITRLLFEDRISDSLISLPTNNNVIFILTS